MAAKSLPSSSAAAFRRRIAASSSLTLELRQRRPRLGKPRRHVRAIQQHGVVSREEPEVVLEHGQLVLVEFGVGRVDIDHVDLAAGDCLIGEPVVEALRRREAQSVGARKIGPTVGAAEKLLRQPESQLGVLLEVRNAREALFSCIARAHCKRVAVVEAQRNRHRQPARRQARIQLRQWRHVGQLEDLARDRAGVIGIDIDAAAFERIEQDGRVAHSALVHGRRSARALCRLRNDLAEDVGLGEALRTDLQRCLGRRCRHGQRAQQQRKQLFA